MFENADTVLYTIVFLVPGYIWHSVACAFYVPKPSFHLHAVLRLLTFSGVNYALCTPLILHIRAETFAKDHPVLSFWSWVLIILVSPLLLGSLTGFAQQKRWARRLLALLKIKTIPAAPTGWDHIFSSLPPGGEWIAVTLKDGKKVVGYFGLDSSASTDANNRDLYIEHVEGEDPEFTTPDPNVEIGLFIPGEQISRIEFRRYMSDQ